MIRPRFAIPAAFRIASGAIALALVAGCATHSLPQSRSAAEAQAARDLAAAAAALPRLSTVKGRDAYNAAATDLTGLLREANNGQMWNRPLTIGSGAQAYRLNFATKSAKGFWKADEFTTFVPASKIRNGTIKSRNVQAGVGGTLVGVRKMDPREPFAPRVGVTGAVTATLDFKGRDATLTLRDPAEVGTARIGGTARPLAADFSAPLAYYPAVDETWLGLMGAMHVRDHMSLTGLYMLQPYDPDRIPIVFVHGLISVPQIWRNVVNEVEKDPQLRGRFQMWVFAYPTGNPVAYSALRFREELEKVKQSYHLPRGMVLVGHSMGGLLSHLQVSTVTRDDWHRVIGAPADAILGALPKDGILHRAVIFDANKDLRRVVFICTPHRGSDMAVGMIGQIGMRLIALPGALAGTLKNALGNELALVSGNRKLMPNGVTALEPNNPMLKVLNSVPLRAPHHSIIGDRGKGDSPNSSDGVVPYWSSHLDSALSEKIVPGPHGSEQLPQTIEELKRILRLHLQTAAR
jgi:hypothetical protein